MALPLFAMQCKDIRAAFTLIEVILCIALITIAVGLVSVWTVPSDETLGRKTPERALASAIKFARIDALKNGRELSIYYNKNGYFSIQDSETKAEKSRIYLNPAQEKAEKKAKENGSIVDSSEFKNTADIQFFQIYPEVVNSTILTFSENPLLCLKVSADLTVTHARIEISHGKEKNILKTDIFTGTLVNEDFDK